MSEEIMDGASWKWVNIDMVFIIVLITVDRCSGEGASCSSLDQVDTPHFPRPKIFVRVRFLRVSFDLGKVRTLTRRERYI